MAGRLHPRRRLENLPLPTSLLEIRRAGRLTSVPCPLHLLASLQPSAWLQLGLLWRKGTDQILQETFMDFAHHYPTCTTVHILATLYYISLFLANMNYYTIIQSLWDLVFDQAYCCLIVHPLQT